LYHYLVISAYKFTKPHEQHRQFFELPCKIFKNVYNQNNVVGEF